MFISVGRGCGSALGGAEWNTDSPDSGAFHFIGRSHVNEWFVPHQGMSEKSIGRAKALPSPTHAPSQISSWYLNDTFSFVRYMILPSSR